MAPNLDNNEFLSDIRSSDLKNDAALNSLLSVLVAQDPPVDREIGKLYTACSAEMRQAIRAYQASEQAGVKGKPLRKKKVAVQTAVAQLLNQVLSGENSDSTRQAITKAFPDLIRQSDGEKPEEPALYEITHTTLPLLTTVLFAFTATILGTTIAAQHDLPNIKLFDTDTKFFARMEVLDAAFFILSIAALLFLVSTLACIHSHAWNYFATTTEQRLFQRLSHDPEYLEQCLTMHRKWHRHAVHSYDWGLIFLLGGLAATLWHGFIPSALLMLIAAIALILIRIWAFLGRISGRGARETA